MKHIKLTTLLFGFLLFGCNQTENKASSNTEGKASSLTEDKEQIQILIRQVLNWSNSKKSIELLPILTDSKDSVCIGFDLDKHKVNLDKLRQTNLFASEFIENYNQIILTLDRKLKNKEFEPWLVGDLPPFIFANDVDPWCLCQDVPYDKPNPWDHIEVSIVNLNNERGEVNWSWGKLELKTDPLWKDFSYKCSVVKENDKWKIAYLQGFDFKESTRKD